MRPVNALRMRGPSASGPISLGNQLATGGSGGRAANVTEGSVYTASASGVINFLHIKQTASNTRAGTFRLVVYNATSGTAVTTLLGETAPETGLAAGVTKKLATLAPITIVAGQKYFIGSHNGTGTPGCATGAGGSISGLLQFADTFADGAIATAGSTTVFGGSDLTIWGTTT